MKSSKYIGKYDYINYYTKQPAFWFFSNAEIQASLLTETKIWEDHDEDEDEEQLEIDSYEYYKEQKELLKNIDIEDPRISEGIIIDKESRKFITNEFPNIKVIDFEDTKYKNIIQEDISIITKNEILNNENIIMFQPVFIKDNLITKPDAFVKQGNEIIIIETKGTSTAKLHHFLDVYFQCKLIENITYLEDFSFEYELCLIKYCYANKSEVPLVRTDSINMTKTVTISNKEFSNDISIKSLIKIGKGIVTKEGFEECPISLTNLCHEDLSDIEYRLSISTNATRNKSLESRIELFTKTFSEFESVIENLSNHQKNMKDKLDIINNIMPSKNDKSVWKNSDLFLQLRSIYYLQGYKIFGYSGYIVNINNENIETITKDMDLIPFFKKDKADIFIKQKEDIILDRPILNSMLSSLKDKKVYFDFETINTPIRPINNCLPFMQIVTQCSIIKDHDDGTNIKDLKSNNILLDPKNIIIQDFKDIVDALYEGDEYSYIVYNANFEKSRLNEMKKYINSDEYSKKIDTINNRLFDLALFFYVIAKAGVPIIIRELGGFYSIKKVLPYIEKNYNDIYKKTGSMDYYSLEIKNGLICQNKTMARFHNKLNDDEWERLAENLKIYCENDVRAMIAVELFIKEMQKQ